MHLPYKIQPFIRHFWKAQNFLTFTWFIFIVIYDRLSFSRHCTAFRLLFKISAIKSASKIFIEFILEDTWSGYFHVATMINDYFHTHPSPFFFLAYILSICHKNIFFSMNFLIICSCLHFCW